MALFLLRDVLPAPSELLLHNSGIAKTSEPIGESDQAMVVYLVMRNADTLLRNPLELGGASQCFPFPRGSPGRYAEADRSCFPVRKQEPLRVSGSGPRRIPRCHDFMGR